MTKKGLKIWKISKNVVFDEEFFRVFFNKFQHDVPVLCVVIIKQFKKYLRL